MVRIFLAAELIPNIERVEGFRRGCNLEKIGMKGQDTSELFFEYVRLPQSNLLGGEEHLRFHQMMQELVYERTAMGVIALGSCKLAISETVRFVNERRVFGKSLMKIQYTRFKLAECKAKFEARRAFINRSIEKFLSNRLVIYDFDFTIAKSPIVINGIT